MLSLTEYNSEDALLLVEDEVEADDDYLIQLLTRLRKTFGETEEVDNE